MIRATLAQANYYVLQKNYLTPEPEPAITEMVKNLAGLPADPSTTPFLSAWARLGDFTPDRLLTELHQRRRFISSSTLMRNRPYVVDTAQYVTWYAATARQRKQGFNAEFRLWGIESNQEIEHLAGLILDRQTGVPLNIEAIAEGLPQDVVKVLNRTSRGGRVTKTTNVALAVRWLAATGKLYVTNQTADWRVAKPAYAPLYHGYPDLDLAAIPAEAEAQKKLVRAYLAAFGPVAEADISLWTGLGKSETTRASGALSRETVLTMVESIPGALLTLKSQVDALKAIEPSGEPVVNILPAADPFIIAHRASRSRYFADQKLQRRVFGSTGAAKPTILVNGQIVGIWAWHRGDGPDKLTWQLLAEVDAGVVSQVQAELERVAMFINPEMVIELV
jgi:hypothetical protein